MKFLFFTLLLLGSWLYSEESTPGTAIPAPSTSGLTTITSDSLDLNLGKEKGKKGKKEKKGKKPADKSEDSAPKAENSDKPEKSEKAAIKRYGKDWNYDSPKTGEQKKFANMIRKGETEIVKRMRVK